MLPDEFSNINESEQSGEASSSINQENSSENDGTNSAVNQDTQPLENESSTILNTNDETGETEIPTSDNIFIKTVPTYPEFSISFEADEKDKNKVRCFLHINKNGKAEKVPVKVTSSDAVKNFHNFWDKLHLSHNQKLVIEVKENGDISKIYIENADRSIKEIDISQKTIKKLIFDSIQEVVKEAVNLNKACVNDVSDTTKKFTPFDNKVVKSANDAAEQQHSSSNVIQSSMTK